MVDRRALLAAAAHRRRLPTRALGPTPPPPGSQVQKVTPEELEVAIANREKAILVDFFGALCTARRASRPPRAWGARRPCHVARASLRADACAPPPSPPAATWCGPCLLLAQELEKVRAGVHLVRPTRARARAWVQAPTRRSPRRAPNQRPRALPRARPAAPVRLAPRT
jgi:thiol-disulfide isomerase/thioredoxin